MATFGAIQSPNPQVLFDPMAVDQQVFGMQRAKLLMRQATEDRAQARMDREREEIGRVSASLLALPEGDRPAAYTSAVSDLQRAGLAGRAPAQYPGHAQIEMLARAAMPAAAQFQLAEKQRASQEMTAMLGGMLGMGAGAMGGGGTPPIAPPSVAAATSMPSGPALRSVAPAATAGGLPPPGAPGHQEAMAALNERVINGEIDPAQASAARTTVPQAPGGYRANPGVAGQFAGLPPPTGTINPLVGAAILMGARTNPAAVPSMLMAAQGQQARAAEMAVDNQRQDARLALMQEHERRKATLEAQASGARTEAELRRAQVDLAKLENDRRTAARQEEQFRLANDPEHQARLAEAKRKAETSTVSAADRTKLRNIETEAEGILDALDTFKQTRKQAGAGERFQSAAGLPTALNSSYNNAALLAKGEALYNLGVLNGPDLDIIRRTLADPGTVRGAVTSQETVNAQIDQIKGLLQQRLATARRQYGGDSPAPQRLRFNPATGKIE